MKGGKTMEENMKVYVVERDSGVDYDQYNSIVIIARNEKRALELAIELADYFSEKDVTITEINGDEGVVHTSFNAG